jgi:hypothetical protein
MPLQFCLPNSVTGVDDTWQRTSARACISRGHDRLTSPEIPLIIKVSHHDCIIDMQIAKRNNMLSSEDNHRLVSTQRQLGARPIYQQSTFLQDTLGLSILGYGSISDRSLSKCSQVLEVTCSSSILQLFSYFHGLRHDEPVLPLGWDFIILKISPKIIIFFS